MNDLSWLSVIVVSSATLWNITYYFQYYNRGTLLQKNKVWNRHTKYWSLYTYKNKIYYRQGLQYSWLSYEKCTQKSQLLKWHLHLWICIFSYPRNRIFKVRMKIMKNTQSPFWSYIFHNGIYAYIQD